MYNYGTKSTIISEFKKIYKDNLKLKWLSDDYKGFFLCEQTNSICILAKDRFCRIPNNSENYSLIKDEGKIKKGLYPSAYNMVLQNLNTLENIDVNINIEKFIEEYNKNKKDKTLTVLINDNLYNAHYVYSGIRAFSNSKLEINLICSGEKHKQWLHICSSKGEYFILPCFYSPTHKIVGNYINMDNQ